ncbi:hypothetical protein W824_07185 [Clavibacter cf. michiganensis LMG 26808]|nr:hypothetical protein W824_07185 [Clavibacter cf. michiganensis LMG 26808]
MSVTFRGVMDSLNTARISGMSEDISRSATASSMISVGLSMVDG